MNTSTLNLRARVMASAITLLANLVAASAAETNAAFSYLAYRFAPEEGWRVRASGNAGSTKLEGRLLQFDFTQGASAIGLGLPDRVLLGRPETMRLRVRGAVKGHPVRVQLRTHFMTFEKVVGEFSGEGEQELAFEAPPGHDWKWFGGENDGKIHGPLRLTSVRLCRASSRARSGSKATVVNTIGEQRVLEVRNGKTEFTVPAGKTVYVQE